MIQEEPEKAEEETVEVKAHRRVKKQNESDYSGLRTIEIHHDIWKRKKKNAMGKGAWAEEYDPGNTEIPGKNLHSLLDKPE